MNVNTYIKKLFKLGYSPKVIIHNLNNFIN